MIAKLKGDISYRGKDFVVMDVGSIGYRMVIPEFAVLKFEGEMTVYTHEVQREDAHELFGFLDMNALELFWKLIGISGVGPRSAQKIVFSGAGNEVREKIMEGNLAFLQSIPGVGKKTAQKIILELRGVLAEEGPEARDRGPGEIDEEAVEALLGLGYKRKEAERLLDGVEGTTEEKIKSALKSLART